MLNRILCLLFAAFLALPLCGACLGMAARSCEKAAPAAKAGCCSPGQSSSDHSRHDRDTDGRCFDCAPPATSLAIDLIPPAVLLVPLPSMERVSLEQLLSPHADTLPTPVVHPPPSTPVALHTLLTC